VWNPAWTAAAAPAPLNVLGGFHTVLAFVAIAGGSLLWNFARQNALRRTLTWDCGYAAPTARMQYTAGSFAGIITEWFGWILRPQRHEHAATETFPAHASLEQHTPETVLEHVIEPSGNVAMRIATAARRLQHGRVQAYIAYLVIGIVGLAAVAFLGDTR
jgi:hydrogenase-4 component B